MLALPMGSDFLIPSWHSSWDSGSGFLDLLPIRVHEYTYIMNPCHLTSKPLVAKSCQIQEMFGDVDRLTNSSTNRIPF